MGRACAPSEGLGVQVLSSGPVPPGQTTGSHPHIEPCQGGLSLLLLTSAQPMLAGHLQLGAEKVLWDAAAHVSSWAPPLGLAPGWL